MKDSPKWTLACINHTLHCHSERSAAKSKSRETAEGNLAIVSTGNSGDSSTPFRKAFTPLRMTLCSEFALMCDFYGLVIR